MPLAHGADTARQVPGARFRPIEGMGHTLEGGVAKLIVEETLAHVRAAKRQA